MIDNLSLKRGNSVLKNIEYSTYLFDFDYTLADSEVGIVTCFQFVLNNNGFKNISDEVIKKTIGLTLEQAFIEMTGIEDSGVIERYRKEYVDKANEVMTANTKLYPETIPMIKKLKEQGKKIGIISTKYRYRIMETLEMYNITSMVDIIIGGGDVKVAKPDPEGLLYAIEKLNEDKTRVLYIGDSLVDAKTALNANVDFVGVTTGTTTFDDFKDFPYIKIINNLGELTQESYA